MTKKQIKESLVELLLFNKNYNEIKEWVFKSDKRAFEVADLIDEVISDIYDYYDVGDNFDYEEELWECSSVFSNLTKLEDDLYKFFMKGAL